MSTTSDLPYDMTLEDHYTPGSIDVLQTPRHEVYNSRFLDWESPRCVQHWVIDPPGTPDRWSQSDVHYWWARQLSHIELFSDPGGSSMILIPRERKGSSYSKSALMASLVTESRYWRLWRDFTWLRFEGEFHRAHPVGVRVFAFVHGSMSSRSESTIRYKDILRHKTSMSADESWGGQIDRVPIPLYKDLLTLFTNPDDRVVDPFAGSGNVAEACENLGRRSSNVELHPEIFRRLCEKVSSWPINS